MKILDLQQYDEKLHIEPIGMSGLGNLQMTKRFAKSMLEDYDIVKFKNSNLYIFLSYDSQLLQNCTERFSSFERLAVDGIFFSSIDESDYTYSWLGLTSYNDKLEHEDYGKYSVTQMWKCPNDARTIINCETPDWQTMQLFTQDTLKRIIKEYSYKQINLK